MGITATPSSRVQAIPPFPTTTAKNAGAAFWAAGLESTFLSSALRFLAPSSAFASLSLTSMAPQRLHVAKQPLGGSPQQRRRKRQVAEVALGAHANADLRAYVLACCLLRKLVRKPKVCRSTAL